MRYSRGKWLQMAPTGGGRPATAGRRGEAPEEEVGRLGDARCNLRCHPQFPRRKSDARSARLLVHGALIALSVERRYQRKRLGEE